jgi:hypothetical protein
MLPKKGKRFPNRDGKGSVGLSYPRAIAAALRGELGETHQAIKIVMRWTGAGERSAKNWLGGTRGPTGEHLLSLVRNSDAVLNAVLRLSGREAVLPQTSLREQRSVHVKIIENIDALLSPGPKQQVAGAAATQNRLDDIRASRRKVCRVTASAGRSWRRCPPSASVPASRSRRSPPPSWNRFRSRRPRKNVSPPAC